MESCFFRFITFHINKKPADEEVMNSKFEFLDPINLYTDIRTNVLGDLEAKIKQFPFILGKNDGHFENPRWSTNDR